MLDIRLVRNEPEQVIEGLRRRGSTISLDEFLSLDETRRQKLVETEGLKNRRNVVSKKVGRRKAQKEDASDLIREMQEVGERIKNIDDEIRTIEARLEDILLTVPNLPDASVPEGPDETHNQEVRRWGETRTFDFEPKAHWDVGEAELKQIGRAHV